MKFTLRSSFKRNPLNGAQADEAIGRFFPVRRPQFDRQENVWHVGSRIYELWQGEVIQKKGRQLKKIKAIPWRDYEGTQQYLAALWDGDQPVDSDKVFGAIHGHSKALSKLRISEGILKKISAADGAYDMYFNNNKTYLVELSEGRAIRIWTTDFADDRQNYATPQWMRLLLWPEAPFISGSMPRQDAERHVRKDFLATITGPNKNKRHFIPGLKKHRLRRGAAVAFKVVKKLTRRPMMQNAEKLDAAASWAENLMTVAAAAMGGGGLGIVGIWKLMAMAVETPGLLKRDGGENWPGKPRPGDRLVKFLSHASEFALPLGDLVRPISFDAFAKGEYVSKVSYGEPSVFHSFKSFKSEPPESAIPFEFRPGATARFYWPNDLDPSLMNAKNIGAIKIIASSGHIYTSFSELGKIWISYDDDRRIEDVNLEGVHPEISKILQRGDIAEIRRRDDDTLDIRALTSHEADMEFRKKYGADPVLNDTYCRLPQLKQHAL